MISYSRVDTYKNCPFLYKLRYLDKLETKPSQDPTDARYLGTAVHSGIEKRSIEEGINSYKSNYSIWNVNNEVEVLKLETVLPAAINEIPEGEYEHKLLVGDFIGYIDLLVKVDEGIYDLYDFKYSNNASNYKKSGQVHVYKYFYEKSTGNKIRNMYYALIPKCTVTLSGKISEKELRESIETFRDKHITFIPIEYDPQQVSFFFARKTLMEKATTFEKNRTRLCNWCEYQRYCETNGADTSELKIKSKQIEEKVEEVSLW